MPDYLYVADRKARGADVHPLLASSTTLERWVVVDRETKLCVVHFPVDWKAKRAMWRIYADCPTRDDMMRAGASYVKTVIETMFD